jgi:hypothetical protein
VLATVIVAARTSQDRMIWADLACCYPYLVLVFTLLGARLFAKEKKDEERKM